MLRSLFPIGRLDPRERAVTLTMWLVGILQGYAQSQGSATIPFVRETLGLTEGNMAALFAITRLAGVGALAFSSWGDRRGRRAPFLTAFALLLLADAATSLVGAAWQFAALQSVVRLTTAAVGTLGVVLMAEQVAPQMRAFSISLYGAGGSFGAGIGLLALPIADRSAESWRVLFAMAAIGLLVMPFLIKSLKESPLVQRAGPPKRPPLRSLLRGRFRRVFWISSAAGLLAAAFTTVGLTFSTERLVADLGFTTGKAVALSLIGGTVGGLGFFVGGRVADVVGRRSTTIGAISAAAVGALGLYWLSNPVLLVVSITISTFGSFAYVPAAAAHRAELFPTEFRSTAGTAGSYLGMLGAAFGLTVGTFTIDRIGLSQTVSLLAIGMVAAALLTSLLPETRGQALDTVGHPR